MQCSAVSSQSHQIRIDSSKSTPFRFDALSESTMVTKDNHMMEDTQAPNHRVAANEESVVTIICAKEKAVPTFEKVQVKGQIEDQEKGRAKEDLGEGRVKDQGEGQNNSKLEEPRAYDLESHQREDQVQLTSWRDVCLPVWVSQLQKCYSKVGERIQGQFSVSNSRVQSTKLPVLQDLPSEVTTPEPGFKDNDRVWIQDPKTQLWDTGGIV